MADTDEYRIPIIADISDLLSSLTEAGEASDKLGEKMGEAGEKGSEGMEKLGESAKEAGEKLNEHVEQVGKLLSGWEGLLTVLGVGAAAEVIHQLSERLMDAGSEVQQFANRTQMSLTEASEWISSAEAMGISASTMQRAFRSLSNEVNSGGKHLKEMGIELTDSSGKARSLGEIFEEVTEKLGTYSSNAREAADAQKLLGSGGQQLVSVHQAQKEMMEQLSLLSRALGSDSKVLADESNNLRIQEVLLNEEWTMLAVTSGPALIVTLKSITITALLLAEGFSTLIALTKELILDFNALAVIWQGIGPTLGAVGGAIAKLGFDVGGENVLGAIQDWKDLSKAMEDFKGSWKGTTEMVGKSLDEELKKVSSDWVTDLKNKSDAIMAIVDGTYDKIAAKAAASMGKGVTGGPEAPDFSKAAKGAKDTALDSEQIALALKEADSALVTATAQYNKLGNEAAMAAKASELSYAQLAATAKADFEEVKIAKQNLDDALVSGSKKAATDMAKAYHDALAQFTKDFDAAKQKAIQDMRDIKAAADQMAKEVSGVLNEAITTGKINWARELTKILSQMVDEFVKYVFEMVGYWISSQNIMTAAQTAAHGNMIGELVAWLLTQLGLIKTNQTAQVTSDAGTSAANSYASASAVPYVGYLIAPGVAAAAYADVMGYVAEAGFDIPPGLSPITQLHPREMVLPAGIADTIRSASVGGPMASNSLNITQNVHAIDSQSFAETLDAGRRGVAAALSAAMRSGMMLNTGG